MPPRPGRRAAERGSVGSSSLHVASAADSRHRFRGAQCICIILVQLKTTPLHTLRTLDSYCLPRLQPFAFAVGRIYGARTARLGGWITGLLSIVISAAAFADTQSKNKSHCDQAVGKTPLYRLHPPPSVNARPTPLVTVFIVVVCSPSCTTRECQKDYPAADLTASVSAQCMGPRIFVRLRPTIAGYSDLGAAMRRSSRTRLVSI